MACGGGGHDRGLARGTSNSGREHHSELPDLGPGDPSGREKILLGSCTLKPLRGQGCRPARGARRAGLPEYRKQLTTAIG
jgi:hypothetical protein